MGAERLDQTRATEDDSLCGGLAVCRQLVVHDFLLRCREFGEVPRQLSTSSRWKGDYTLMNKHTEANYEGEDSRIGTWNL